MTTTTTYVGSLEEVATTGSNTTTTAYYGALATSVNGALSYTLADGLGSVSEAVNASTGAVTATQLYAPYGAVRYQSGTLPGSRAFTGQVSDAATSGLDYYGARYYDPAAGQFTSADTTLVSGLNRYGYVGGSPETLADPTGQTPEGGANPWGQRVRKGILWVVIVIAQLTDPVGALGHGGLVQTGLDTSTGRARNGGDEQTTPLDDEPIWGVPAGASGADGSPDPGSLNGKPYVLVGPNGQPYREDEPTSKVATNQPPHPQPSDTPYHPAPDTRDRPNSNGVPGQNSIVAQQLEHLEQYYATDHSSSGAPIPPTPSQVTPTTSAWSTWWTGVSSGTQHAWGWISQHPLQATGIAIGAVGVLFVAVTFPEVFIPAAVIATCA